jgi:hypothetical protein
MLAAISLLEPSMEDPSVGTASLLLALRLSPQV